MIHLGTIRPGTTIRIPFDSFALSTGAPSALSNFAAADVLVYKDSNTTERASTTGFTATTTFDSLTGNNEAVIDLSSDATADFFKCGSSYKVVISPVTIDGQTMTFTIATFDIGYPGAILNTSIATLASQTSFTLTAGPAEDDALKGMWAIVHDKASAIQLTWVQIASYTGSTKTVTLAASPVATFTIAAIDNFSVMGVMPLIPGANLAATFAALTVTGLTTLTGNVALADGLTLAAPSTTNRAGFSVTGNGTGAAMLLVGGSNADAIKATGNGTLKAGLRLVGASTLSLGLYVSGGAGGAGGLIEGQDGFLINGGVGGGAGTGLYVSSANGTGIIAASTGGGGDGFSATKNGVGVDIRGNVDSILTKLPAALTADGNIKADILAINGVLAAAVRLALTAGTMSPGIVDTGSFSPTATEFEATMTDTIPVTADRLNGRSILFTSGVGILQACTVVDYVKNGSLAHFTVSQMASAPANAVTFVIV